MAKLPKLCIFSPKKKVDHFFAVGSPLGVFILMREHESLVKRGHRSSASLVPTEVCRRIHNLHHPSDPVVSGSHDTCMGLEKSVLV